MKNTGEETMNCRKPRWGQWGWVVAVLLLATVLRGAGVYRGIPHGVSYHPDVAKQVQALDEYLQGKYVWYTGLRFYDSYPLFLNHFDEWIIRLVRSVSGPVARHLGCGQDPSPPATETLYYWTMSLRWLYGVVVVMLTGLTAHRLRFPFSAALGAMLLVAISPLNIVVAHYGTGDMACDLFFALTALGVVQHARTGRWPWLAAAGVMAGWTYAGKYNGGMAAFLIAGYAALLCLRGSKRLARFIGMGFLSAGGFVAGVLVAMPQFLWAWKQTWRDMLRVIEHVKNYRAPEEFLELPVWDRAWTAFTRNAGGVLWALGGLAVLAALAGLALAIRDWRRTAARAEIDAGYRRQSILVSLFGFPWLVLMLSLTSKLNLHPFYFSWIYPALALAAMHALAPLLAGSRTTGRLAFGLLGLLLLGESGRRLPSEIYFWRREDVRTISRLQENNPVLPATSNRRYRASHHEPSPLAIRDLLLEPRNIANFRNRWGRLESPEAPAWRNLAVMPLPVIPFGGPLTDWIALNGPALPRSDWSFRIADHGKLDVMVVSFEPLQDIRLGLQTGVNPALVDGQWGGQPVHAGLGADDWTVLHLQDLRPVRVMQDKGRSGLPIYHYRLELRATPGPAWATLLRSAREADVFRLFGGDPDIDLAGLFDQVDFAALAQMTARIRYRNGDGPWPALDKAAAPAQPLWDPAEVLPAGSYRLKLKVVGLTSNSAVRLALFDKAGRFKTGDGGQAYALAPGSNELEYLFEKPFAPFQCAVAAEVVSGQALIGEWSLWPDVEALTAAACQARRPAWQRKFADRPPGANRHPVETTFGGRITVHEVAWPDPVVPGQKQPFQARISLRKPIRHFAEHEVFFHLCGADGQLLMSAHVPMKQAAYAPEDGFSILLDVPAELVQPIGKVRVGIWNRRTKVRLPVSRHPPSIRECSGNLVEFDLPGRDR